jgi:hypothetical protein
MADSPSRTIERRIIDAPTGRRSPSGGQPSGSPPNANPPKLSYRDLAWWAETADGRRDVDLVITEVMQNGAAKRGVKKDDEILPGERLVLDAIIHTESAVKGRPPVSRVLIEVDGETIECKAKDGTWCDSIFCSESAIEKFLFPYYHSQRLLTDDDWDKLKADFMNPLTVAIGHVHPSNPVALAGGSYAAGSFYRLRVKPAAGGMRAEVKWESIIP